MSKLTPNEKPAIMAKIGLSYAVIEATRQDLHGLEVKAAPEVKAVFDKYGAGPYKMAVPDKDGNPVDYIVTFRKDGDKFLTRMVRADSIQTLDASIGKAFSGVDTKRQDLHSLEVQAATEIKAVFDAFGQGPHKMPVPDDTGALVDYITYFRRDGDKFLIRASRADQIT